MFGGKDQTVVKEKIKIKEKVRQAEMGLNQPPMQQQLQSMQYQQGYSQQQQYPMTGQQYPMTTMPGQGSTFGTTPLQTNLQRKRSSSSSSSDQERNRNLGMGSNLGPSNLGNVSTLTQPSTSFETGYMPTGNIQTGYGPTHIDNPNLVPGSTGFTGSSSGMNPPLGKNLYGETGYATNVISQQQPFPGQTVYVQKPPQKISEKTKTKFQQNVI